MLFVCVANVCRSPAMQFLTGKALESAGLGGSWELASAGTRAAADQRMCRTAATAIEEHPGGAGFSRRHRSRRLSADLVERAGLILVASHQERAAVARLSPSARERTFTMIEAALLVESASREPARWDDRGHLSLGTLVGVMHDNRGTARHHDASEAGRRFRPRSRRPATLDIRDVHGGEVKNHAPVLEGLRWASSHLAASLVRLARTTGE
jgi:low molecular weight protein-tyrosine phosphatase